MPLTTRASLLSLCLVLLIGCATLPPGKRDPRDPWERMNRATYRLNDSLDRAIVKPVARGYVRVAPRFVRSGVTNFFDNLEYPIVMVNDLLQGQVKGFVSDTARLLLNTTLGIGGLFDPATAAGLEKNDRDLGQTLGKWGVKPGPYLVVPLLGPYDLRDGFGALADTYADPRTYTKFWVDVSLYAVRGIDRRSRLLYADAMLSSAYDPYAFVRNAYLQNREFKVHGGHSQSEEDQEQRMLQESGEDEAPPPSSPSPPQAAPAQPPPSAH
jgi:phospholipid-binding lipoprotein MlaA